VSFVEANVIDRVRHGDEEAFSAVVEAYQRPVYNLCYRMLGNAEEAEDAAQETFWRAYQAIERYDTQRSFITWLLSIAAHYCIDQQRKRRMLFTDIELLPEASLPDGQPGPESVVRQNEDDQVIYKLLNTLPAQDRAAVILKYWYEFSEVEIAKTLNLTQSAVKSRLFRARKVLAQNWESAQPVAEPKGEHDVSPAI
jgi:RNA polymerase sigma-70 factor (ECF subfamily)